MQDVINNIIKFIDVKELKLNNFIEKYNENDILINFVNDFRNSKIDFNMFYNSINYADLFEQSDLKFYCKRIYSYTLRFIANYDNKNAIQFYEITLRKMNNIYKNSNINVVNVFECIKCLIIYITNNIEKFHKYSKFRKTIICNLIGKLNNNLTSYTITNFELTYNDI